MLVGGSSVGTTSWASEGAAFTGTDSPFYARLAAGTDLPIVLLFEAQVVDRFTEIMLPFRGLWSNAGGLTWRGDGDDAEFFPELLMQPALIRSILFGGAPLAGESSEASAQFGAIEFAQDQDNPFGGLWERLSWEGSPWTLSVGGLGEGYSTFEVIARGEVSEASWDFQRLTLTVVEPDEPLRQPIQTNVYDGTGGLDGADSLKDRRKPLLFGRVSNRRPVLIDPESLVYQVHDGPINDLDIFDGGVRFTAAGPTDVSDVYASAPAAGEWLRDLDHGVFRLGNEPQFSLTFDAEGDATTALGGFVSQLVDVCKRIVVQRSTLAAEDLDGLAALAISAPYDVGLYLDDGSGTIDEALSQLLAPLGCYAIFRSNGLLFFDQLAPAGPAVVFEDHEIEPPRRIRGIRGITSLRMRYQEIVPQVGMEIAAGLYLIDPERQAFLAEQWRDVINEYTTARRRTRSAIVETALQRRQDAVLEASRQADLSEFYVDIYEVVVKRVMFSLDVGQTVRITYPNFGFESGRDCMIIGITPNVAAQTMTLTLWT